MPTYEYKCSNCGHLTEAFQKMSDAALSTCPNCGKETLVRIVTGGAGVLYKGEGWYVTDYSHKSSGGKEQTSETKAATATKGESSKSGATTTPTSTPTPKIDAPAATPAKPAKKEES